MIFELVISLLVSFLLGFFAISLIWPRPFYGRATATFRCCLAFGFGSGISSVWFFWWLCLAAARGDYFYTFVLPELLITLGLGLSCFFFRRRRDLPIAHDQRLQLECGGLFTRCLAAMFLTVVLSALVSFGLIARKNPHGEFDAVATWNLRARFLARGSSHWRDAFAESPSLPHPDYPLLLPATIARSWKYIGGEPVMAPISVAFFFTFSSVGLLCSSLALLRNRQVGYLGGIVLLGVYPYVVLGASQYADVATGFFMMSAIAILGLHDAWTNNENVRFLVLAGAAAGFCAWTKNEGLLFLSLLLAARFLFSIRRNGWRLCGREAAALGLGILPVLAAVAYFKLGVAPANYYLKAGNYSTSGPMQYFLDPRTTGQKITDVSRYWLIAKSMASEIVHLGGRTIGIVPLLLLYLFSARVRRKNVASVQTGIAVLVLMLAGYFFVYLTTPMNLEFHLRTSLSRLLLQLWPSAVFVFFMATSAADPGTFKPYDLLAASES